jgi:hypothetical protein
MNGIVDENSTTAHVLKISKPEVPSIVDIALKDEKPFPTATISYHTLRYYVNAGSVCRRRKSSKQILHELRQDFVMF